ncbi:hypothetical protein EV657_11388 [Rhodovulum visakhapatnamense]|uniref:Uncharacterized protein n=1 Tax=Rhodovulum visakhapatnamense TaxID=364297 RepID=A0A4R8FV05_9RHOB|nr:hypothetical protein EV657_11388 [Rhodovulum visakhapatnamense]
MRRIGKRSGGSFSRGRGCRLPGRLCRGRERRRGCPKRRHPWPEAPCAIGGGPERHACGPARSVHRAYAARLGPRSRFTRGTRSRCCPPAGSAAPRRGAMHHSRSSGKAPGRAPSSSDGNSSRPRPMTCSIFRIHAVTEISMSYSIAFRRADRAAARPRGGSRERPFPCATEPLILPPMERHGHIAIITAQPARTLSLGLLLLLSRL